MLLRRLPLKGLANRRGIRKKKVMKSVTRQKTSLVNKKVRTRGQGCLSWEASTRTKEEEVNLTSLVHTQHKG